MLPHFLIGELTNILAFQAICCDSEFGLLLLSLFAILMTETAVLITLHYPKISFSY